MKFCKDCRHLRLTETGMTYARCALSVISEAKVNPVSGEEIPIEWMYCSVERKEPRAVGGRRCGAEGTLFEEALPQCDDCETPTDWKHAVQLDPWGRETGEVYCENCAEKHWDRQQEKLMEET